jgi:BlaI family transcriptional regulator, penicillinase repressor
MDDASHNRLSRRERQIMDALYRRGKATAMEVLEDLPDPPSYTAVRTLLRILETKGHIRHTQEGARYVYAPRVSRERARRSILENVVRNFYDGSREKLMAALLDGGAGKLSPEELRNFHELIERAQKEGR